ncbi:hypothetical protein FVB9532_03879 [Mesonia oceanica]|uniref:Uncharacterized protein n=1 Tax=Mesonia oceanica TaxID=2687242 RepID=A0AC61YDH3_9FLAO|nr:hypothetical protein FVB9532_03879 [Mesonia oceanica]
MGQLDVENIAIGGYISRGHFTGTVNGTISGKVDAHRVISDTAVGSRTGVQQGNQDTGVERNIIVIVYRTSYIFGIEAARARTGIIGT